MDASLDRFLALSYGKTGRNIFSMGDKVIFVIFLRQRVMYSTNLNRQVGKSVQG